MQRMKRRLAVGAAALAALGAGGAAYAATQSSTPGSRSATRNAFLDDVATRLHVTRSQLDQALSAATADQLNAAVQAGRITRAQADAILQHQRRTGAVPFLGGHRAGFNHRPFHATLRTAATYLGLTPAQLWSQLAAGKSLADVARARGKSVSGLKAALLEALRTRLDAAVKAGRVTRSDADQALKDFGRRIDALVNRLRFARPAHPGAALWRPVPPWGGP